MNKMKYFITMLATLISCALAPAFLAFTTIATPAFAETEPFVVGNTWIFFRNDSKPTTIPNDVIKRIAVSSSEPSLESLASEIAHALGESRLYKDIVIEKSTLDDKRTALLVSSRSAWRMNSIRIENNRGAIEDFNRFRVLISTQIDQPISSFLTLDHDAMRMENALRNEGFLKARVKYITRENTKGHIDTIFTIDRGNPCLIADFVPRASTIRIFRNLATGDLCNKTIIANRIKEEEANLRNLGYIYARVQFNPETDLITTRDLERATLKYSYTPGDKWSLSIIDRLSGANIEDEFMRSTGFVLGDLAFSSQEEIQQKILQYLYSQGYADATVTPNDLIESKANEKKLVMEIDRGRRLFISESETEFLGNLPIPKEKAIAALNITPGVLDIASGVPFVESELENKRVSLTEYLVNLGYVDTVIGNPEVRRTPGSDKVVLRIPVRVGYRYRVQNITLSGKPPNFDTDNFLIKEYFEDDNALQPTSLTKLQDLIQNELFLAGYRKGQVLPPDLICFTTKNALNKKENCRLSPDGQIDVDVQLKIAAGPLFRIGKVTASDAPFEKGEGVLNVSGLKSGDILSTKVLAEARDRILKHGLFGSVVFDGTDALSLSEDEKLENEVFRDINIVVMRQRNWNLTLNPSWNSDRGYGFSTQFQRNNLTTDGLQFLFHSSITQERYQNTTSNGPGIGQVPGVSLSAGLREALFRAGPWVTPFDVNFITFGQEVDVRDERRTTSRLQSDIAWRPFWFGMGFVHKIEVSYAFSGYPLGGVSRPVKVIDNSDNVGTVEITASTALDTRNNPVWPRNGYTLSLEFSHSSPNLGSDAAYDKLGADGSFFFPWSRNFTQAIFMGGKQISSINAPGARREKISSAQVRGYPAMDSQLGPLLWYLEKDTNGNCVAKLSQAAATNTFNNRLETRYRHPQSNWGAAVFYDTAVAYFSPGEIDKLNTRLSNIATNPTDTCPANGARVIGNDAMKFDPAKTNFWSNSVRSSYQSVGFGFRLFLADMFALHLDWGIPTHDPNESDDNCKPFSDPYGTQSSSTGVPQAPSCILRKPQYLRKWETFSNSARNVLGFLVRTQISIEGKF